DGRRQHFDRRRQQLDGRRQHVDGRRQHLNGRRQHVDGRRQHLHRRDKLDGRRQHLHRRDKLDVKLKQFILKLLVIFVVIEQQLERIVELRLFGCDKLLYRKLNWQLIFNGKLGFDRRLER